ncbi:MAG: BON domain-containing protein [Bryobacteraceae bacterium]
MAHWTDSKTFSAAIHFLIPALLLAAALPAQSVSQRAQERIAREVRHEILMTPYFDVFDNVAYKVDGYNVTLLGQVTQPLLKSNIEKAVKGIEGVEKINNQIEVLPVSPNDDRLRIALFRAIYGFESLQRYAMPVIKPIRIIVKNGNVTLEGVVNTSADKTVVGMRANGVPGIFKVTNNLEVEKK